jgi:hypothetical protein
MTGRASPLTRPAAARSAAEERDAPRKGKCHKAAVAPWLHPKRARVKPHDLRRLAGSVSPRAGTRTCTRPTSVSVSPSDCWADGGGVFVFVYHERHRGVGVGWAGGGPGAEGDGITDLCGLQSFRGRDDTCRPRESWCGERSGYVLKQRSDRCWGSGDDDCERGDRPGRRDLAFGWSCRRARTRPQQSWSAGSAGFAPWCGGSLRVRRLLLGGGVRWLALR